tara:strand:- start:108 stop:260 length:153 start_codon:yes stop_codon:yes gene_type:complete
MSGSLLLSTPQPPKTTALSPTTVMVWPERGEGLSPLVAGWLHWISPSALA